MPISLIGTRGVGKTTMMSFLFQAMNIYTHQNPDKFRYFLGSELAKNMKEKMKVMKGNKRFPAATDRDIIERKFVLGFEPPKWDIPTWIKRRIFTSRKYGDFLGFVVSLYDIDGAEVEEFIETDFEANRYLKELYRADIPVFLIDASKFTKRTKGPKNYDLVEHDQELTQIISGYAEYRAKHHPNEKLHPIIFLTKMDELDEEIRQDYPGIKKLENEYDKKIANRVGRELLERYLTDFQGSVLGSKLMGIELEDSSFFYSWTDLESPESHPDMGTEVERSENGREKRLKLVDKDDEPGGRRNKFPLHMYIAFLDHLDELKEERPDPEDIVDEVLSKSNVKIGLRAEP